MHLNGEKNASCRSRTPKICTRLQIFQSNLPFSHQSSESHLVGPYSNLSGPNPTGWRCTMCPRGRQFSSDKISLKGSKSQKFRRTAFMPPHLYSGVLFESLVSTEDYRRLISFLTWNRRQGLKRAALANFAIIWA